MRFSTGKTPDPDRTIRARPSSSCCPAAHVLPDEDTPISVIYEIFSNFPIWPKRIHNFLRISRKGSGFSISDIWHPHFWAQKEPSTEIGKRSKKGKWNGDSSLNPIDYGNPMAVLIAYLDKYNPLGFEVLDVREFTHESRLKNKSTFLIKDSDGTFTDEYDQVVVYTRIVIRNRNPIKNQKTP